MNEFNFFISLDFYNTITADTKEEAKKILIEQFKNDYNIILTDNEIKAIN